MSMNFLAYVLPYDRFRRNHGASSLLNGMLGSVFTMKGGTYYNLLTCLSCPRFPRCFFSLKELCDALAHHMMYSFASFFFFSVWRTCPSHRKPETHHWLGRMVHLYNQDC